ncbi:hypothetical protein, partial [Plasmodium yoelii yoelii]
FFIVKYFIILYVCHIITTVFYLSYYL